ncbi:hypothetical protein P7K49_039637, partial [Saguinus oedipus]
SCGCGCSEPRGPGGGGLAFFMFACLHTPQLLHETHSTLSFPGFNLCIGRPKGPQDLPAEWTQV